MGTLGQNITKSQYAPILIGVFLCFQSFGRHGDEKCLAETTKMILSFSNEVAVNLSSKTMEIIKNQEVSTWLSEAKKISGKNGTFFACDKTGVPVVVEWFSAEGLTPEYSQALRNVWDITRDAYVPVEKKFLAVYSDEEKNYFDGFKQAIPGMSDKLDTAATLTEKLELVLREISVIDIASPLAAMMTNQFNFFVLVKDAHSQHVLGYAIFLIMPDDKNGDIKVTHLAVAPVAQGRGLATILIGAIIRILPSVKRLYLSTRITNDSAQAAYKKWGFTPDRHPVLWAGENSDHWVYFEYLVDQVDVLQKVAYGFT